MKEKIYTIPVNDAFGKKDGCPLCSLYEMLEKNEAELILGASMMEPDVRARTNSEGFCGRHFKMLFSMQKKLPLALILESHLDKLYSEHFEKKIIMKSSQKSGTELEKTLDSCYICNRIDAYMDMIYSTIFTLYEKEGDFRKKTEEQPFFCLPHYSILLKKAPKELSKRYCEDFLNSVKKVETEYLNTLGEDIKWFIKKFDYRFTDEPWKNSKDSIERAIFTLSGEKL